MKIFTVDTVASSKNIWLKKFKCLWDCGGGFEKKKFSLQG